MLDKIKKLLALAGNNPNEHEAMAAMEMASALALKAGIDLANVQQQEDKSTSTSNKPVGEEVVFTGRDVAWVSIVVQAAAELNRCRVYFSWVTRQTVQYKIVGTETNRAVTKLVAEYLESAVENLYKSEYQKLKMRQGGSVTKRERAEFRRTFKHACAQRINVRAHERMRELVKDDKVAKAATGSTALVVADHVEQQLAEVQQFMSKLGLRFRKTRARRSGSGTQAGWDAGGTVGLDTQVGGSSGGSKAKKLGRCA